MDTAYKEGHIDIVTAIAQRSDASLHEQLFVACLCGDMTFVSQSVTNNRDKGQDMGWKSLMDAAYSKGHIDIVRFIQDSERVTLNDQLMSACNYGDLTNASQCIDNIKTKI